MNRTKESVWSGSSLNTTVASEKSTATARPVQKAEEFPIPKEPRKSTDSGWNISTEPSAQESTLVNEELTRTIQKDTNTANEMTQTIEKGPDGTANSQGTNRRFLTFYM